jgi:hypothetical protein
MNKPGFLLASFVIFILLSVGCTAAPSVGQALNEETPTPEASAEAPSPSATFTPFQPLPSPTHTPLPSPSPIPAPEEPAPTEEAVDEAEAPGPEGDPASAGNGQTSVPRIRREIPKAEIPVRLELVAEGLDSPSALASPPDRTGRIFITGQSGSIYLLLPDGELRAEPLLDLRDRLVSPEDRLEGGLYNIAFHPEFAQNGVFFVFYTTPVNVKNSLEHALTGRLSAFAMSHWSRFQADPASEQVLLEVSLPHGFDRKVNLTVSSEGSLSFSNSNGQDPVIRNSCFDLNQSGFPETACSDGGSEEIPHLNLGSALSNGSFLNDNASGPLVVEGLFYQGLTFPSYEGRYFFAAQPDENKDGASRIFVASSHKLEERGWVVEELEIANQTNNRLAERVTGFGQDSAGRLYILSYGDLAQEGDIGKVYKVMPFVRFERSVIDRPEDYLPLTHRYARVTGTAPIYKSLDDVKAGQPTGSHGGGSFWVSERNSTQVNGRTYYWVSWAWGNAAWISASHIRFDAPLSHLKGIHLQQRPGELLALTTSPLHVRSIPGLLTDETIVASLGKYDLVSILERRVVNGVNWFRIGPDQWSHGDYLRVLTPSARPEGVEPGEKWIEVNLALQTVIAHQGDTPVFATLTSTGRVGFPTTKGLYRVWAKLREAPMQWLDARPPYSLANVPYIMYFNKDQGLHGAYWHDLFGSVRSAGCVNLSPHDSKWLFHWAGPEQPADQRILYTSDENPGAWVWVHDQTQDIESLLTKLWIDSLEWKEDTILLP